MWIDSGTSCSNRELADRLLLLYAAEPVRATASGSGRAAQFMAHWNATLPGTTASDANAEDAWTRYLLEWQHLSISALRRAEVVWQGVEAALGSGLQNKMVEFVDNALAETPESNELVRIRAGLSSKNVRSLEFTQACVSGLEYFRYPVPSIIGAPDVWRFARKLWQIDNDSIREAQRRDGKSKLEQWVDRVAEARASDCGEAD
ncbi:hypothetical protein Q5752_005837 [Cryptotrichosporon argae]